MKTTKKLYISSSFQTLFLEQQKFKTIGIGVTFSPNLKANLYESARLTLMYGCHLVLIHVGDSSEEKKEKFTEILAPFKEKGLSFEVVFNTGDPVVAILETVADKNIDLLILGALKREKFFKYYMGSIARKITRKAPCSVLLLINPSVERVACKHVVVNGLEHEKTKEAISAAFFVAHALKSERITIVEEIKQQEIAIAINDDKSLRKATLKKEQLRRREDSRIRKIIDAIPEIQRDNISIDMQPIFGKRGYSIGHFALVVRADLLVMNAPEKTGFWDRIFPHDMEYILSELPTDLLIIQ